MRSATGKVLIFTLMTLLVVSCKQKNDPDAPPEILYGEDSCDECAMIISEPRYAASYVTESGDVKRFDDIGGMLLHDQKMQEEVYVYWVHDHDSETWIKARQAVLVWNPDLITPMGWGLAAFVDHAAAEAYVAEHGGKMATFAEIQEHIRSGELGPSVLSFGDHIDEMDGQMINMSDMDHHDDS